MRDSFRGPAFLERRTLAIRASRRGVALAHEACRATIAMCFASFSLLEAQRPLSKRSALPRRGDQSRVGASFALTQRLVLGLRSLGSVLRHFLRISRLLGRRALHSAFTRPRLADAHCPRFGGPMRLALLALHAM